MRFANFPKATQRRGCVACVLLMLLFRVAPAWAQFGGSVVFDPSMFTRQLEQLQQETAAVQTLAAQLQYAVQNTTGGGAGLWRSNQGLLTNLGNIVAEQQGLSYTLSNLSSEFQRIFPGYVISQSGNVAPQAAQGFTSTLNTLSGTLQSAAAQAQEFQAEQATFTALEAKNQGAIGQLQTIQVGNEIALQQVQQLQMLRQLVVTMINAQNVVAANQVSQAAQTQAQQQQWLSGGPLVPYPSTWSSPNAPHAGLPTGGQP
jgi:type IV secretion system protein TrbJ